MIGIGDNAANRRRFMFVVVGAAIGAGIIPWLSHRLLARSAQDVTVSGCVERDAAARSAVYKLVARVDGGSRIYRLTAPASVDLAAEVGHTVEVTGTVADRDPNRREEAVLTVRQLKRVSDRCS